MLFSFFTLECGFPSFVGPFGRDLADWRGSVGVDPGDSGGKRGGEDLPLLGFLGEDLFGHGCGLVVGMENVKLFAEQEDDAFEFVEGAALFFDDFFKVVVEFVGSGFLQFQFASDEVSILEEGVFELREGVL